MSRSDRDADKHDALAALEAERNRDRYNGWKNRETWAFNLHWQNDQGLYNETLERAREYLTETYGHDWESLPADEMRGATYGVGELVRNYWDEAGEDLDGEPAPEVIRMMGRDVGSFWRVDPAETGAAVIESLGIES